MRVAHEKGFEDVILDVMHSMPFMVVVLVLWALSAIGLIILILMHSGKGTGVSEVIAGSIYGTDTSSSVIEKNLDRLTVIFAIVFMVSLLLLMICFPTGSVGR